MGRIACERHGKTSVVLVCEHLEADVSQQRALAPHRAYSGADDDEGRTLIEHQLCDACGPAAPVTPVCAACFREA